jgi:hypothetical protein
MVYYTYIEGIFKYITSMLRFLKYIFRNYLKIMIFKSMIRLHQIFIKYLLRLCFKYLNSLLRVDVKCMLLIYTYLPILLIYLLIIPTYISR